VSDALAIAAVTATLRNLLFRGINEAVPGADVSTRPPDKARDGIRDPQLNLFLYHAGIDGAWRNMDMPGRVLPGESGNPPLPLNLYYLITAYGEDTDDNAGHRLLGAAMRVLHDHPLLGPRELLTALPDSDLHRQVERVRITNQTLTLDEMSKLWTTFQTQYRVSTAYQVSVVLIESRRPVRTPPPVATRGSDDTGPQSVPDLELPVPTLTEVTPAAAQSGAEIVLTGHHLGGGPVRLRFTHRALPAPVFVGPPVTGGARELRAALPASLPAGAVTVAALVALPTGELPTNEQPLTVVPRIAGKLPVKVNRNPTGAVSFSITVTPPVAAGQEAFLLVSDRQIAAAPFTAPTSTLAFSFAIEPDTYPIRLRVGGTDSELIDRSATPLRYDPLQQLVVA
jgi:Pvc16 N-terminal domain